jgi:hypothetical protein
VNFTDEARFYSQQTPHVTKDANFRLVQPRPPSVTLPRRQPSEDWRIAKTDERDYDSVGSYDQIKKPKQFVTQCKRTGKRIGFCDSISQRKMFIPAVGVYEGAAKGLDILHKRCRSQ